MIGLMRKDFYSMLLYLRQVVIVVLFIGVFSAMTKSTSMVGFMLIFLSLNMVQSCLFVDEKNHWDQYALTMPLLRKDVVKARYVILVLIGFASFALGIQCGAVPGFPGKFPGRFSAHHGNGVPFLYAVLYHQHSVRLSSERG